MEQSPAPPPPPRISVVDPVSRALDWTGRVLFQPFDVGKWFVLGFCAWLAWIGQSGGNGSLRVPADDPDYGLDAAGHWIDERLPLVIGVGAVLLLLIVGLIVLFTWLSSRGKLMFLDGVVHNRGAVVEPWKRFREQGNSLFGLRIVVGLIALAVFSVLIGVMIAVLVALGIERGEHAAPGLLLMLAVWVAVLVGVGVAFGLVAVGINDIVVPIMWLRGCRVMDAWREFLALLSAHTGTFVLYVLMKILLGVVMLLIACAATCVTCCIAALPYIGVVILLPLYVFRRSYSIYFLGQFGPEFARLVPVEPPAAETPPAP